MLLATAALSALSGCASTSSFVHVPETTLGKVVVYRNGVAYFERTAHVEGDVLRLTVPADKVDDFLKSLIVVDAKTNQPAPVSYPSNLSGQTGELIDMEIKLQGPGPHDLKLTYVTEAPAWKPSYRLVLGANNRVNLEAWAIVDNTSGEDWKGVKLGVGSSSALSFRFDLWSVRLVQRETLQADNLFAQAPPTGGATHGGRILTEKKVLADLSESSLAAVTNQAPPPPPPSAPQSGSFFGGGSKKKPADPAPPRASATSRAPSGGRGAAAGGMPRMDEERPAPDMAQSQANRELESLARRINSMKNQVIVEGFADRNDSDKNTASLERANRVREQLVRQGVPADKIVAVGRGEATGKQGGVRFIEAPVAPTGGVAGGDEKPRDKDGDGAPDAPSNDPIGTSHFETRSAMNVPRGSAAMVSIYQSDTDGEVVYLYDNESPRGNASFPFRAVRMKNPTDSALESGPVLVYGEGRFIGEGLSEPIPARSIAFIPFALDRQIVVEKKSADRDEISKIIAVQRGVFSTEVQRTRRTALTLTNRMQDKAVVYIRHTVPAGYKLTKGPVTPEKIGEANLFRVEVPAGAASEVVIEEATPVLRTADLRSAEGMGLVKLYLSSAALEGPIKEKVAELIKLQQEIGTIEQQISTLREQMGEFKQRMDELHAQLVTLRAVKNPQGNLMQHLEKKLQEVSERMSKATIELVSLQERLMVTRIRFQDGVADLSTEKKDRPKEEPKKEGKEAPRPSALLNRRDDAGLARAPARPPGPGARAARSAPPARPPPT